MFMKYAQTIHSGLEILECAQESTSWPFEEAQKIVKRYEKDTYPEVVIFETGYGPSGLPHIGTFGEVVRTSIVRHAFRVLTQDRVKTKLLCFSDDVDGMRKIPENIPNKEILLPHKGKPLTRVPDPFGKYESFGHHNNAMLRRFLDSFGFDYEFASAFDYYTSGFFDDGLVCMLENYEKIMQVMLPTLREERRKTYSPILPIHPETGVVMQVPIEEVNVQDATVVWTDPETGKKWKTSVKAGGCKAQWKPDWALRWVVLKVDYEMSGKDHIDNVKTSRKICEILGGKPPEGFNYELFLDEKGEKISKSKGNGITINEWLTYAPPESLALYMFQKPRAAKKLYFDVIPKAVDQYYSCLSAFPSQNSKERLCNPVWHMHQGVPPHLDLPISFALLLNLVSASNADEKSILWGFISRYDTSLKKEKLPELDRLVDYAIHYFKDFVKPKKIYRMPDETEISALNALCDILKTLPPEADSDTVQNAALDVARSIPKYQDHSRKNPQGEPGVSSEFFKMIYQTLIGQDQGPRFGSFAVIYGIKGICALIEQAVTGDLERIYRKSLEHNKNIENVD